MYENKCFPPNLFKAEDRLKEDDIQNFIMVGEEKFAVVGTALMLMQMIHEYCR